MVEVLHICRLFQTLFNVTGWVNISCVTQRNTHYCTVSTTPTCHDLTTWSVHIPLNTALHVSLLLRTFTATFCPELFSDLRNASLTEPNSPRKQNPWAVNTLPETMVILPTSQIINQIFKITGLIKCERSQPLPSMRPRVKSFSEMRTSCSLAFKSQLIPRLSTRGKHSPNSSFTPKQTRYKHVACQ